MLEPVDLLPVADAAKLLNVSQRRVRQMLAAGALSGRRLGSVWLVDEASARDVARRRRAAGRPMSVENAWKAMVLASGCDLPRGHGADRARLRRLLDMRGGLGPLLSAFGQRGDPVRLRAHPGVLSRLAGNDAVVLSGASAALHYGLDLVAANDLEGYTRVGALDRLEQKYALERDAYGNVLLRLVPDDVWIPAGKHAPLAAVAVDLVESRDPRSRELGLQLIEDLDRGGGR